MFKRIIGVVIMLLGGILACALFYKLVIARDTHGRYPIAPMILSGMFIYVGYKWARGEVAGQ